MLGTRINDRYAVEARLGGGGGGEVWLVRDDGAGGRLLALKLMPGRGLSSSDLRRFSREFFTLRDLRHPHLVPLREYGRLDGTSHLFYTMDWVEGGDLAGRDPLEPAVLARLMTGVCRGLAFLHARGILHGDLKGENLLVEDLPSGRARLRLADFGLSQTLRSLERTGPGERGPGGTLTSMAPEQLSGDLPGPPADLYALGVVLYRQLAGRAPFTGDLEEVARGHLEEDPEPPSLHGGPEAWDPLVLDLLSKDPGKRPGPEEMLRRLGELIGEAPPLETPSTRSAWLLGPPLVGRQEPLETLVRAAEATAGEASTGEPAPRPEMILLVGEEGVGKTRVLREFEEQAVGRGLDWVVGDCRARRDLPYAAWREAFASLALRRGRVEDPFRAGFWDEAAEEMEADALSVAEAAARVLLEEAARGPLVLVLENLHWLDGESAELLAFLRRRIRQERLRGPVPLLLVGSKRVVPDPGETEGAEELAEVREGEGVQRLELTRLEAEETRTLVEGMLGPLEAPSDWWVGLQQWTDGNPLFLLETLREEMREGRVGRTSGGWRVEAALPSEGASRRLATLARNRIETLGEREREVGAALSVLREASDLALIGEVAGLAPEDCQQALLELEEQGLVRPARTSEIQTWDLSQGVFGRVWRGSLGSDRARRLHRRAARALEVRDARAARRAHHWEQAGEPQRALPHLLEAAREARALRAPGRVLEFSRRAEQASGGEGTEGLEAREHQAWALAHTDRREEAARVYRSLLESSPRGQKAPWACRLADVERNLGRLDRAEEALRAAGDPAPGAAGRDRLLATRILLEVSRGRLDEAAELARRVLQEGSRDSRLVRAAAWALLRKGDPERAAKALEEVLRRDEAEGRALHAAAGRSLLARVLAARGDLPGAVAQLRRALATYQGRDEILPRARLTLNLGVLEARRGRTEKAAAGFEEAARLLERTGDVEGTALALHNLAEARRHQERFSEALELHGRVRSLRAEMGARLEEARACLDRADVLLEVGRPEEAERAWQEARRLASSAQSPVFRLESAYLRARIHHHRGETQEAGESLEGCGMMEGEPVDPRLGEDIEGLRVELLLAAGDDEALEAATAWRERAEEEPDSRRRVAAGLLQGRAFLQVGRVPEAEAVLQEALERAEEAGLHGLAAEVLHHLALGLRPKDSPVAEVERLSRAMEQVGQVAGRLGETDARSYLRAPGRQQLRRDFAQAQQRALDRWKDEGDYFPDPEVFSGAEGRRARQELGRARERIEQLEAETDSRGRREGRLASLMEVAQEVNALRPLEELLPLIVDRAVSLLGAQRGFLMLREGDGDLSFKVARDRRGRDIDRADFQVSYSIVREVARTGRNLVTSDARDDVRFRQERSVISLDLRSVVVVPLQVGERILGVMYLDNRFNAGVFRQEDARVLRAFSAHAANAIENARLYQSLAERERMAQELRIAGEIQANLLPQRLPAPGSYRTAARMIPAREVGGDFYDALEGEDAKVRLVVGDVSGKGVPAGLLMIMAQTLLRAGILEGRGPRQVLAEANGFLERHIRDDAFLTALLLELDPRSHALRFTNAGHLPPALLRSASGRVEFPESDGIALGILADSSEILQEQEIELEEGDLLVLYSDGVTECRDPKGEFYGRDRLGRLLEGQAGRGVDQVLAALLDDLERFRAGAEAEDDVTVLALQRQADR